MDAPIEPRKRGFLGLRDDVGRPLLDDPPLFDEDDSIGRLMTPHYVAVREDWTVQAVLDYIRANGQDSETLNVIYVVDEHGQLIDDVRIREVRFALEVETLERLPVAEVLTQRVAARRVLVELDRAGQSIGHRLHLDHGPLGGRDRAEHAVAQRPVRAGPTG